MLTFAVPAPTRGSGEQKGTLKSLIPSITTGVRPFKSGLGRLSYPRTKSSTTLVSACAVYGLGRNGVHPAAWPLV